VDEPKTDGAVFRAAKAYFKEFAGLRECSRNFWVVQLVNLLDGVAYFGMLTVSTLYLSETLGFNDKHAAWLWGVCMAVYTGVGFVAGFVGDSLGIKRTLHLSVVLLVISRLAISFTESRMLVIPALFVIAVGTAIMTPILISATKRYTTKKTQTGGFNMLYFLMNIGALVGNYTLDPLRETQWGNRSVFMVGSLMSILCWVAILLLWKRGIDDVDEQVRRRRAVAAAGTDNAEVSGDDQEEKWEAPWTIAASVFRESAFWRFILFLVILVGVRLVFEHQYQVYPKYYQRTIAEYLFCLEIGFEDELSEGPVSNALRTVFAEQRHWLSDAALISPTEWHVVDADRTYIIRRRGRMLSIYPMPPAEEPDLDSAHGADPLFEFEVIDLAELNEGRLPDVLRQAFADNDRELAADLRLLAKEKGTRWQIQDAETTYYVRKDENKLSIYASDAPIGKLNSINPLIICFGVILSTPIVARFRLFNVMFVGVCFSAASMLILTIHPGWFTGLLGISLSQGYMMIVVAQIIVFSFGEVIWSPRLYEYTAAIAPEGREASYMGLSYLPMFFARFSEGPLAGEMLTRYCPPDVGSRLASVPYAQSPQFMNVILAAIAISTPVLILVFRGVIQKEAKENV